MKSLFDTVIARESAVEYGLTVKSRNESFDSVSITSSMAANNYLARVFGDEVEIFESFVVLTLSRAGKVTGWARVSSGGRASVIVDVTIIAKVAVDTLASAVIIAHNHPSGSTRPSAQDDAITARIKNGLALLDIKVFDHIIVTPQGDFYSYSDEGRL